MQDAFDKYVIKNGSSLEFNNQEFKLVKGRLLYAIKDGKACFVATCSAPSAEFGSPLFFAKEYVENNPTI